MKKIYLLSTLLVLTGLSPWYASGQTVEWVTEKTVHQYENKSYKALTSVTLVPAPDGQTGFNFTAGVDGQEFSIVIDNPASPAPIDAIRQNFLREILVMQPNILNEIQLLDANTKKRISTTYTDGLGRTIQLVSAAASPAGYDMVLPVGYDQYGVSSTGYLPYVAASQDGRYQNNALNAQASFYNNSTDKIADDAKPFAVSMFEASPLGRITEQGGVGADWQPGTTHTARAQFRVNTDGDQVRQWTAAGPGSSFYSAGLLAVSQMQDENSNKVWVFTDKLGRSVLKRVQLEENISENGTTAYVPYLDTYYVYDDLGRLAHQVPPKAVAKLIEASWTGWSSIVSEWGYSYTYDSRGRLVEKKAPDSAPVYIGYDPLDRPVLVQDGRLRQSNQWYYTKYDQQGRVVMEGIYTNTTQTTRTAVQTEVLDVLNYQADNSIYYETKQASTTHGYTNQSFPTLSTRVLKVYYYDNYDFDGDNIATNNSVYTPQGLPNEKGPLKDTNGTLRVKGKLTGMKALILDTSSDWEKSYLFYDMDGQPIQVRSNNHLLNAMDNLATSTYNFDGTVNTTKVYSKIGSGTGKEVTVTNDFHYDPSGRVKQVYQNNNGTGNQLVAQYEYNELGQVTDKKLHGVGSNFLQSVDLRYNIRGWLTHINKSNLSATETFGDADALTADLFGMELLYNTVQAGLNDQTGDKRYWNGNVSAVKWKVQPDVNASINTNPIRERSYKFDYDKMDRLRKATYQALGTVAWDQEVGAYNEQMSYDHNGNMLTLQRYSLADESTSPAGPVQIDNLTYTYKVGFGNQLKKVEDATGNNSGFRNLSGASDEYGYDAAGNLTRDNNKSTAAAGLIYEYNELNKVKKLDYGNGKYILYSYNAAGVRLKKQVYVSNTLHKTLDYVGGFVYENAVLSHFPMPEGRVRVAAGTSFTYEYIISDHLGNARVSFEAYNNGTATVAKLTQENHYYPFGMSMKGMAVKVATPSSANKNLFNAGSELQDDFKDNLGDDPSNYSTFFREYDPVLGRFNGVDPLADHFSSINPYQFAFNNPLSYNDPTGALTNPGFNKDVWRIIEEMYDGMGSSGAVFGEYTSGGGYHYYRADGTEVGGYGSTYTEESGEGGSDGPAAAGSPYATVSTTPVRRFPTFDPAVAAAINLEEAQKRVNGSSESNSSIIFVKLAYESSLSSYSPSDASNFNLLKIGGAYYTNMINIQRTYLYTQINPIKVEIVPVDIPSLWVQVSSSKFGSTLDAEWVMSEAYDKTLIKLQTSISNRKVKSLDAANKFFIQEFTRQLKNIFKGLPVVRLTPFAGNIPKSDMSE